MDETSRPSTPLRSLSAASLRWSVGALCAVIGSIMLVTPHQLRPAAHVGTALLLPWLGLAFLLSGIALLALAASHPPRRLVELVHAVAASVLLFQAVGFAGAQAWGGASVFGVLGLGTGLAGLLPLAERGRSGFRGDFLSLVMGIAGGAAGLVLLLVPQPGWPAAGTGASRLGAAAAGMLVAMGPALAWAQLRRRLTAGVRWAVHLLAGLAFVALAVVLVLPNQAWTSLTVYGGLGLVVAGLPGLRRAFEGFDPLSLRTRLALVLTIAASSALIVTVALVTEQEERLAAEEALRTQQRQADAIAQNVEDFITLNGAHASTLAVVLGQAGLRSDLQRLLEEIDEGYDDISSFIVVDRSGFILAHTGESLLAEPLLRGLAADAAPRYEPGDPREGAIVVRRVEVEGAPRLVLSVPIETRSGWEKAALVLVLENEALDRRLARADSDVYLTDTTGVLVAAEKRAASPSSPAPLPMGQRPGDEADASWLVAQATIPRLSWVVSVERPRYAALAGVRRGRDAAFILLAVVVVVSVAAGIAAARWVSRPLAGLAEAVDQLKAGNLSAPVAPSDLTEVERLSAAFRELRDQLAGRIRESERLAEELRGRAEALVESDRRKDEFLAMLAHELRNPLGAISNASYVLEELGVAESRMQRSLGVIRRQTEHLSRLVDDLLDVSRITRGKVVLRKERVDVRRAIRNAADGARPSIRSRRHQLRIDLPEEPLIVEADATRLEQVLGNLLWNAAKFTEPGGSIDLEAHAEGDGAVISVRDSGEGIPPELLPRIFDLFTQGEQSLDRPGGGLGIGLTLVAQLVEMHGGRVEARSEGRGQGSQFLVRLPLVAVAEAVAEGEPGPEEVVGESRRVLVVEDNLDSAEMLSLILSQAGHLVRVAKDGPSALAAVAEERPDVLLLDLGLPGMDGYEVARRLAEEGRLDGVLVVAISGYGRDEDRSRAVAAGFHHHLVKPVSPRELVAIVSGREAGVAGA